MVPRLHKIQSRQQGSPLSTSGSSPKVAFRSPPMVWPNLRARSSVICSMIQALRTLLLGHLAASCCATVVSHSGTATCTTQGLHRRNPAGSAALHHRQAQTGTRRPAPAAITAPLAAQLHFKSLLAHYQRIGCCGHPQLAALHLLVETQQSPSSQTIQAPFNAYSPPESGDLFFSETPQSWCMRWSPLPG